MDFVMSPIKLFRGRSVRTRTRGGSHRCSKHAGRFGQFNIQIGFGIKHKQYASALNTSGACIATQCQGWCHSRTKSIFLDEDATIKARRRGEKPWGEQANKRKRLLHQSTPSPTKFVFWSRQLSAMPARPTRFAKVSWQTFPVNQVAPCCTSLSKLQSAV